MRQIHAFVAASLVLGLAGKSRADLAPPGDFVETCTLEKQASAGQECQACRAYYGNHDHCSNSLSALGFAQKCRSRGASTWSEVWCRSASPNAAKVPASILAQLSDAQGKPGPLPSASAAPAPSGSLAPLAPSTVAAPSTAPAAATAKSATPSAPTPAPSPTKKGSCAIGRAPNAGTSSLLVVAAFAVGFLRRRPR